MKTDCSRRPECCGRVRRLTDGNRIREYEGIRLKALVTAAY
ncbi:hypothetical protein [Singulisphaera acidiphila]|uniref:Uncharacterized protein n=1 Tax=Singulisphaera acidiphila (strain ATCC BAA-1392 / DSM 18658 / VKM B-2454 / MOB10) TaxID=886293 RepID=L0D7X5_SINAD|nr:hypothetical protein [Singulisphaera acidiphila]AGA24960.1 hypothetical protein Sinac_0536 [Singulisphaera acidiphila DSM 18658]